VTCSRFEGPLRGNLSATKKVSNGSIKAKGLPISAAGSSRWTRDADKRTLAGDAIALDGPNGGSLDHLSFEGRSLERP
jgi:hypothetical protein